jgi:cellulose synthase/poly-beta-1,6-N-acetylglucosamine synthase-like glycosyltransferase
VAAAIVFYSYLGYPLLLALAARLRPTPEVRRDVEACPAATVVIVAHDEEAAIGRKLDNCLSLDYPADRLDVLVASDGSTDRTEEIVEARAGERVRLLRLPGPRGKPSALNVAATEARGEILLLCDTRQELDRGAARALVANFADPTVGAVSGELLFRPAGSTGLEGVGLYWQFEKWIRHTESRLDSVVGVTGAICAMRRALYRPLDPRTILDDVALPMSVVQAGYRVLFEPAARAYDPAPEDPRKEYRRKVRTLAGNYQLVALRPSLLNPLRNRLFIQFVSHKLSRLAVPWCLLVMLVASGVLAARGSRTFAAIASAQVAFYLLAAAGGWLKKRGRAVRALSVPYSLTLLNVAAGEALLGFLLGRERVAWRSRHR